MTQFGHLGELKRWKSQPSGTDQPRSTGLIAQWEWEAAFDRTGDLTLQFANRIHWAAKRGEREQGKRNGVQLRWYAFMLIGCAVPGEARGDARMPDE